MADSTRIMWTFDGPDSTPFMAIKAYERDTSFELMEWRSGTRDGEPFTGWYPLNPPRYPWTIESAVEAVKQRMLIKRGGVTGDLEQIVSTLKAVDKSIARAVREAEQQPMF